MTHELLKVVWVEELDCYLQGVVITPASRTVRFSLGAHTSSWHSEYMLGWAKRLLPDVVRVVVHVGTEPTAAYFLRNQGWVHRLIEKKRSG